MSNLNDIFSGMQLTASLFWIFLALCVTSLGILTFMGFFSRYSHWLDIPEHFRFQYFVILCCIVVLGLVGQKFILGGFALLLGGLNFWRIYPLFIGCTSTPKGNAEYRFLLSNVLRKNREFQRFFHIVEEYAPDFIALIEPDQEWLDGISTLKEIYPFWHTIPRPDNYGLAFLSKHPIKNQAIYSLTQKGVPTLIMDAVVEGKQLHILVTHPPPPKNSADLHWRDEQMVRLAQLARDQGNPVILCGDFNITPWAAQFRNMERSGMLRDSSRCFGFQPTWPADRPLLRTPIDHFLASASVKIISRRVGNEIGSDHLPVIVDFRLC